MKVSQWKEMVGEEVQGVAEEEEVLEWVSKGNKEKFE